MQKYVFVTVALVLLIGCKPASPPTPSGAASAIRQDVADLLRNPPASGESIEIDAYFSRATTIPHPGGFPPPPDQIACPSFYEAALTDRPFLADLAVLSSIAGNPLPDDAPWLIAATPDMLQPGVRQWLQLPYHARFRGHLSEAALAHCPHAERIFVVEQVVQVYEEKSATLPTYARDVPDDYATWTRYHDAKTGFSLFYPPDWQIEQVDDVAWHLRAPQWPDWPVVMRVHAGETHLDQYDSTAMPPLLQGISGFGVYQQGGGFGAQIDTQQLDGYEVGHDESLTERSVSVLFSSGGRTYELALRYPLGFDAPQPLLTTYSIIVERFRLDVRPGPSPTPPVKQSLGVGPFLSQDEALTHIRDNEGQEVTLLDAKLMSEVEARHSADACSTFESHPDGVWLLTVQGVFEDQTRTIRMYLDATTGEQLCGEEIILNVTPWPTMPPNATATPVSPSSTSSIRLSPTPAPPPPPAAAFPSLSLTPIARPVSDWTNRIAYRGDDSGLWLMKPDGSDRQLIHLPADLPGGSVYGEDTHFVWSTDGSRIAFVSRYDVLLVDLANGITQLIYRSETLPRGGPEGILPAPAWSPDNRRLAFADNRILHVADLAAQRVYTIADDVWSKVGSWDPGNSFAWTADGRSVLYLSGGTEVNDLRGLAVVSLDEPLRSRLIVPDVLGFALTPDGQQLVYHLQDGGLWQIETRCALSSDPAKDCLAASHSLVSRADDRGFFRLRWSPDGSQLLALSPFGGLWLIDAASGKIQQLDPGGSVLYMTNPWSPDGRQLVLPLVTDGGMTNSPLIIYDLTTRKAAQLAGFDTFNSQREAAWGRAAPKE